MCWKDDCISSAQKSLNKLFLSVCLSVCLSLSLSLCLSLSLSVCLPVCLSVSVCLPACLSVYLSVCPSDSATLHFIQYMRSQTALYRRLEGAYRRSWPISWPSTPRISPSPITSVGSRDFALCRTDRQSDRQTDGQTDSRTDRQTETDRLCTVPHKLISDCTRHTPRSLSSLLSDFVSVFLSVSLSGCLSVRC